MKRVSDQVLDYAQKYNVIDGTPHCVKWALLYFLYSCASTAGKMGCHWLYILQFLVSDVLLCMVLDLAVVPLIPLILLPHRPQM